MDKFTATQEPLIFCVEGWQNGAPEAVLVLANGKCITKDVKISQAISLQVAF